jgi:hypothetical protein
MDPDAFADRLKVARDEAKQTCTQVAHNVSNVG